MNLQSLPLGSAPREQNPPWARSTPPAVGSVRRGVHYDGLSHEALDPFVDELLEPELVGASKPIAVYGAIGPQLFWARNDGSGRWIPYDLDAVDENRDCLVRERPWPFCWGDVVWAVGLWIGQPIYLRWELDEFSQVLVGVPTFDVQAIDLERIVSKQAVAESKPSAVKKLPAFFWTREVPTARLRK